MKKALKVALRGHLGRSKAAAVRLLAERHALALIAPRSSRPTGRILCHHSIGQPCFGVNDVSPRRFARQIESALAAGYRFVPAPQIAAGLAGPKDLALTFDDGARSLLTEVAPILSAFGGLPFMVFVVTGWADEAQAGRRRNIASWTDVEALVALGAMIGSHSVSHPNFARLNDAAVVEELEQSRETLRRRIGESPADFAIPFGLNSTWTPSATAAARAAGYTRIYAQAENRRPPDTIGRSLVTGYDADTLFRATLEGAFDRWDEWY
ncbi:polysaccharide deacetylase family protein [Hansschlegelia quercus]|uniref:Chitooligosaccharide deacetylase n=2 Tax=Hansschlegelia quercus TaxID=2528245 RepID=A0A4Q9G9I4_9HYPH|nr:polysaccharide deacetylase family protein [Hansschlegelia quercus]